MEEIRVKIIDRGIYTDLTQRYWDIEERPGVKGQTH